MSRKQTPLNEVQDAVSAGEGVALLDDPLRLGLANQTKSVSGRGSSIDHVHSMITDLDRKVGSTLDGIHDEVIKDGFVYTENIITDRVALCAFCNAPPILISRQSITEANGAVESAVRCTHHKREHGTHFEAKRKSAIIAKWNHMQVRLKHLSTGQLRNTHEGLKLAQGTIKKTRRIS